MKHAKLIQDIKEYLENADPEEVIKRFEELGHEFEPLSEFEIRLLDMGFEPGIECHFDGTLIEQSLLHTENYHQYSAQINDAILMAADHPAKPCGKNEFSSNTTGNALYAMAA